MSDNDETPAADPGETGYTAYWRAVHDAGVPPVPWEDIPADSQDSWRGSAAEVLARHGSAGWAALRSLCAALTDQAAAWVLAADGSDETDAAFGGERAATAVALRRCAADVRAMLPVILKMDAPPPAEPYEAELIPERVDTTPPGTAAGGTL